MKTSFCNELDSFEFNFEEIQSEMKAKKKSPLEHWAKYEEDYPNICTLAKAILVLPHSTVSVERIFSNMKDIKTIKRKRLTVENLEACVLCYQNIGRKAFIFSEDLKEDIFSNPELLYTQDLESNKDNSSILNHLDSKNNYQEDNSAPDFGISNVQYLNKQNSLKRKASENLQTEYKKQKLMENDENHKSEAEETEIVIQLSKSPPSN